LPEEPCGSLRGPVTRIATLFDRGHALRRNWQGVRSNVHSVPLRRRFGKSSDRSNLKGECQSEMKKETTDLKKETTLARRQKCSSNTELTLFRQARTLTRQSRVSDSRQTTQPVVECRTRDEVPAGDAAALCGCYSSLRSSVTHQRSNLGFMTNDGSPSYDQGRERREEDLDTRGEEADRHPSHAIRQGN
jgi:hypothetical protein